MSFGPKPSRKSTKRRPINSRPDCLQLPSKSARQTNSIRPASQQAFSLVVGPSLAENRATAHESRRWVLGPSLTENLQNADPSIPGQIVFNYRVNKPGRPILNPASRQAISWVVGPRLAGNRPTARRAPSMGFGTKSSRTSAERRPIKFRPECFQLHSKSAQQTNSKTNQQAGHFVVSGAKLGREPNENRSTNLSVAILAQALTANRTGSLP